MFDAMKAMSEIGANQEANWDETSAFTEITASKFAPYLTTGC